MFPREEKFGICSQITKSAVSIPSNVAEGSSRSSEKSMPVLSKFHLVQIMG